jgi:hypothetical protein
MRDVLVEEWYKKVEEGGGWDTTEGLGSHRIGALKCCEELKSCMTHWLRSGARWWRRTASRQQRHVQYVLEVKRGWCFDDQIVLHVCMTGKAELSM